MTIEQELTAMIEAELAAWMDRWLYWHYPDGSPFGRALYAQEADIDAIAEMPEPDRQNAALRKLYWLATDPDDMVH